MGIMSVGHWVLVLLVCLLVFGVKKMRVLGRELGSAVREFHKGFQQESEQAANLTPLQPHKKDEG